jgi:hypothetical protein
LTPIRGLRRREHPALVVQARAGAVSGATCLTITADCDGSKGVQVKPWKRELQRFADETGLKVTVGHSGSSAGMKSPEPTTSRLWL